MHTSLTVSEMLPLIRAGKFPGILPLAAAAELLSLTKSGLLRRIESGKTGLHLLTVTSEAGTVWNGVSLDSLAQELVQQERALPDTEQQFRQRLYALAKAREVSRYGDFMESAGLSWRNPQHRARTGHLLGIISEDMWAKHRLLPSVLVVNKANHRPSAAFFEMAEQLGAYQPSQNAQQFVEDMTAQVFASAATPGIWN